MSIANVWMSLALTIYSTLSHQYLLEKHLLNAYTLQMFSGQCSHMKFLEELLHL